MALKKEKNEGNINFKEIEKLIEILEKSKLEEIEIEYNNIHLRLKKSSNVSTIIPQPIPQIFPQPIQTEIKQVKETLTPLTEKVESKNENIFEVKSPMVGTFYRAPAPNAEPFVKVGDIVKRGQTLCIIEAMKIMNEIESEVDGKVIEIKVQNAEPVEYGEVLMLIEKS